MACHGPFVTVLDRALGWPRRVYMTHCTASYELSWRISNRPRRRARLSHVARALADAATAPLRAALATLARRAVLAFTASAITKGDVTIVDTSAAYGGRRRDETDETTDDDDAWYAVPSPSPPPPPLATPHDACGGRVAARHTSEVRRCAV